MEKYIIRKDDIDVIIKAALTHYQFETIHPFMSGNGRIGRILSYVLLAYGKILTRPITCLSHYLNLNKVEYMDRIEQLQSKRDYEQWIKFFIKSVIFAADDSLGKIKSWLCIRKKHLSIIDKINKPIRAIKDVYAVIERNPILNVNTVAEKVGISYNTAASALKTLTDLQIVKRSNNMMRNRDYAYIEFLECFINEGIV